MSEATPSFAALYQALHDKTPFPWQIRLADDIVKDGHWPDLIDLPTGFGKTSTLEVALYCLAMRPDVMPRRTLLVIDRRIVVDQGAMHARNILDKLKDAHPDSAAFTIAQRLRALFGGTSQDDPFAVAVMRGGMPRDNDWAKRPDQPMIGVSTVDQVGSRLLFRGYGISKRSAPIHAGLLANDTLILLDEVHLSVPFAQTLDAIQSRYHLPQSHLPHRFHVVQMSATPGAHLADKAVFGILKAPRDGEASDLAHPILHRRFTASKTARLQLSKARTNDTLAQEAADAATQLLKDGAQAVGVVVNRVDTARIAHALITKAAPNNAEVILITGRMRPIDRDHVTRSQAFQRVLMGYRPAPSLPAPPTPLTTPRQATLSFFAAPDAPPTQTSPQTPTQPPSQPVVIVSTQCIEAGADLDFDALVTECASIDALRQRFGRLNRSGDHDACQAVILARADLISDKAAPDPIYGDALKETWAWLQLQSQAQDGPVDFGLSAFNLPTDPASLAKLLAPAPCAPILLPSHLDAWAQTSPPPSPDPDISLWLHGPNRAPADVQIIWRADLPLPTVQEVERQSTPATEAAVALHRRARLDEAVARLTACRPSSLEAVTIPIYAARAWLSTQDKGADDTPSISDVVTGDVEDPKKKRPRRPRDPHAPFVALRWTGDDDSEWVKADDIRPHDVLIVHTTQGGLSHRSFDPTNKAPATDLGDLAQRRARGKTSLRFDSGNPALLAVWQLDEGLLTDIPTHDPEDPAALDHALSAWLTLPNDPPAGFIGTEQEWRSLSQLKHKPRRQLDLIGGTIYLTARKAEVSDLSDSSSEGEDSAFHRAHVPLSAHCEHVHSQTRRFATHLHLSQDLTEDLTLAARLHDVGKADPRFQKWLVGGSEVAFAMLSAPLAKSALPPGNPQQRRETKRLAGYPDGYRHELLSVHLVARHPEALAAAHDPDLVLHLIGSHHGWCRPFPPFSDDLKPVAVSLSHHNVQLQGDTRHQLARLDSGVADRFWTLVDRYGWWGLAWLESILRLADHRASEDEEKKTLQDEETQSLPQEVR